MIAYLNGINYFRQPFAQMAELVDALVSNTSGVKPVPVRARLWAQSPQFRGLFIILQNLCKNSNDTTMHICEWHWSGRNSPIANANKWGH